MRVAIFNTRAYDRDFLTAANVSPAHELVFLEPRLTVATASLAHGFPAVSIFVNDSADAEVVRQLAAGGTRLLALRSAGFNHVDLAAAEQEGIAVARVPAYSPWAVAEHAVGLMLSLNRKLHKAYARVRDGNFRLEGLLGFDMHGRTAGIVGTGAIGAAVAHILHGMGCQLLLHDPHQQPELVQLGARYVSLDELLANSDIISLHCPLLPQTRHLIDSSSISRMKSGVMLINTSRGALIDTVAVIEALKSGAIGYLGLDVYEEEEALFFSDQSNEVIQDDVFLRLLTFPNVMVTGHQAFFTRDALARIAETTLGNITTFERGEPLANAVRHKPSA